ncbi:MAG: helix-turn-helix domain-containing protein [Candidatus Anstonellales archaeon]
MELENQIIEDYRNGMLVRELVRKYGLKQVKIREIVGLRDKDLFTKLNNINYRKQIRVEYEQGKTIEQLKNEYGISELLVEHCINRKQYILKQSYIQDYVENDIGLVEICKQHNVDSIRLYQDLYEVSFENRRCFTKSNREHTEKRDSVSRYNKEEVISLLRQGYSLSYIAKKYGVTKQAVHEYLRNRGIKINRDTYIETRFKEMIEEGKNLETIQNELKISYIKLLKLRKKFEVAKDIMWINKYKDVKDDIIKDYTQGMSLLGLRSKYKLSLPTIKNILKLSGLEIRKFTYTAREIRAKKVSEDEYEAIYKLYKEGWSVECIAKEYGISTSLVYLILNKVRKRLTG